jgi:hypothetical protein
VTPAERTARLVTLAERLRERHAAREGDWFDLFVAVGRAQQAAFAGDDDEIARWLTHASNVEYALCGDCDTVGSIATSLGIREDAPHG